MSIETFDIIVVGGGNAGFSAALSGKEAAGPNARVLVIDKAPENWAGGNSYFTAGATRMTYAGLKILSRCSTTRTTSESRSLMSNRILPKTSSPTCAVSRLTAAILS